MTRHEIASLACKLLALWLLVHAVFHLNSVIIAVVAIVGSAGNESFEWQELLIVGMPASVGVGTFLLLPRCQHKAR